MARYVEVDKLKNDILMKYKKNWEVPCSSEDRLIQSVVTDLRVLIEMNTTTDVAPRAEVEYWKEQCFRACMNNGCLDKAIVKAAVAREIFAEIEDVLNNIGYFDELDFEALKKKYTEGQK